MDIIIIIINALTARVVGAPQMILQPVFSIFPCSPLPSGTCRTPGLVHTPGSSWPGVWSRLLNSLCGSQERHVTESSLVLACKQHVSLVERNLAVEKKTRVSLTCGLVSLLYHVQAGWVGALV